MTEGQFWKAVNGQTGHRVKLHTREDCPTLARSETRQVSRETHPHNDLCGLCSGRWTPHQPDPDTYDCAHCERTFRSQDGRDRHVLQEHRDVVEAALKSDSRKVSA